MPAYGKLVRSTAGSSGVALPTSAGFPGFTLSTIADNPIRFPLTNSHGQITIMYMTNAASSVANYASLDVRYGNKSTDPAWAGRGYAVTSTVDKAFATFMSTAVIGAVTASEFIAYTVTLDTAPFACNFGGTSSNITDAYESFIEVYPTQSTAATYTGHNTAGAIIGSSDFLVFVGAIVPPK
jgi:hypothetical protein